MSEDDIPSVQVYSPPDLWSSRRASSSYSVSSSYYPSDTETEGEDDNDTWSDTFEEQDGDKTPVDTLQTHPDSVLESAARKLDVQHKRRAPEPPLSRPTTPGLSRPTTPSFQEARSPRMQLQSSVRSQDYAASAVSVPSASPISVPSAPPRQNALSSPISSPGGGGVSPSKCPHCTIHSWLPHSHNCPKWHGKRK